MSFLDQQPYFGGAAPQGGPTNPDFFSGDTWKTMQQFAPQWQSLRNPDGSLKDQYSLKGAPDIGFSSNIDALQQRLGGINLNTQALDALRGEGLRSAGTPSAWGTMARNQAMNDAGVQGNTALSSGMSALASRGGVSQGARERMATKSARDVMMAKQKAGMDVSMKDETNRLDTLKSLPGMEVQALQPELAKTSMWTDLANSEAGRKQGLDLANRDYSTGVQKSNLQTILGDTQNKQAFDMSKYQEIMKAWGADRTAQAQEKAGK